ncbi:hypothetical protein BGZ76_002889 [Entomortierella beljakovae]|nr:hypothetical protein BGZ76_002889 [Entomortierella beljakovae]
MQDIKTARSKQDQDENSLGDHVDMGVYSKNSGIRCLGSCKRNDMCRRFIRHPWHQSPMQALDAGFFITNARPNSTKMVYQTIVNRRSRRQPNQMPQSSTTSGDIAPLHQLSLSHAVADAVQARLPLRDPSTILNADTTNNERYVNHIYLSPPKHSHRKSNIMQKQAPSLMIRSDTVRPGFTDYRDIKGRIACDKVVVQAESLHRLDLQFYGENVNLILDEFSSLCEQMTSTMTMDDMHDVNNQVLREFIKGVSRVVCLDADLTNDNVQFMKKSRRNDVHVIHNTFKARDGDQVMMYETEQLLKLKVLDLLQDGKRIWISSTHSAENTEALHQMLQEKGFHGMCVTKNTSEADKRDIVKNINTHMANLNYFIHTLTISVGIDYNVKDHVDYVVGFFNTHS